MHLPNAENVMRRFLILATALLAGGLLTACDDDSTGPVPVVGLYTLVTVNGEELPVELGDPIREIIAGSIQLNSDGTYSRSSTVDLGPGPVRITVFGTFTVDGSTVEFDASSRADFTGTFSGNTLTLIEDGDTLVYHK